MNRPGSVCLGQGHHNDEISQAGRWLSSQAICTSTRTGQDFSPDGEGGGGLEYKAGRLCRNWE